MSSQITIGRMIELIDTAREIIDAASSIRLSNPTRMQTPISRQAEFSRFEMFEECPTEKSSAIFLRYGLVS